MDDGRFDNWRKSSRSGGGSNCVEFGCSGEIVGLRDSKDPDGTVLTFRGEQWRSFVLALRDGEFDLD